MDVTLYTKTGDLGETGLLYGGRVLKNDPRVEAYGTVDEAISAMGIARSFTKDGYVKILLLKLQKELFVVGSELATSVESYEKFLEHFSPVSKEMVSSLEFCLDELMEAVKLPPNFIVPGSSPASAAIDLGRSIIRRAERCVVTLKHENQLSNDQIIIYLNRLADVLFILARYEDRELDFEVVTGENAL